MKSLIYLFIAFLIVKNISAREVGETEIITEDGIEVFQEEKYYLLKKNVKITSDTFMLSGENIKIFFNKNLYDIIKIEAKEDVTFNSDNYKLQCESQNLKFDLEKEEILLEGIKSKLFLEDIEMFSDGKIIVNNSNGNFELFGENSKLLNEEIIIEANSINGVFKNNNEEKEIEFIDIFDDNISYVKSNAIEMYARSIQFDNKSSIIKLDQNVKIIRNSEIITGDYGSIDTKLNSYKIKSKTNNKVKVVISNQDE
tara:strand:- start:325 stop:1089 length:765 start_codon:yes stop_codon:yes gene_type:complete